ncbi:MAG: ABC transporter substrate-binding protein [Betaproteobacteria bacterium]|nr:ABC transporter substrate-binding protein [Betaproteobacteria bacterium]
MSRCALTLACAPYDRTLPLFDGRVRAEGIDLNVILLRYEDTFWRMLRHQEFDVSEMSLSSYLISKERGPDLIAIPVFLSRVFRHSSIYVNANSGIEAPADLVGRRAGVPEYQMTAALWIRGILQHEYGVPPEKVQWFNGGLDEPGRVEKLALSLPPAVSLQSIPADRTLNDMLVKGELDALTTARPPSSFVRGNPAVRRLFKDSKAEEIAYWKKTGIYPPMHCVAIRRDVYEKDRWIAQSLYKAFNAARALCTLADMWDGHLRYALPFLHHAAEESTQVFGSADPWRYGLEENRHTIETLVQYSHEQGLIPRRYAMDELFAKEALDASRN